MMCEWYNWYIRTVQWYSLLYCTWVGTMHCNGVFNNVNCSGGSVRAGVSQETLLLQFPRITLVYWYIGTLAHWYIDALVHWCIDILDKFTLVVQDLHMLWSTSLPW